MTTWIRGKSANADINLLFFCDYENWTGGDPLPNRYSTISGITKFDDKNGVPEENTSPLVGSKSGGYNSSDVDHHKNAYRPAYKDQDFYISFWMKPETISGISVPFSNGSFNRDTGISFFLKEDTNSIALVVQPSSPTEVDNISASSVYFVEGWFLQSTNNVSLRVNNTTIETTTGANSAPNNPENDMIIGGREVSIPNQTFDGLLDNVLHTVASPGSLVLPNDGDWQYNNGNGRSFSEYKSRYNL